MCGRYALFSAPDKVAARFGVEITEFEPTYNAAPSQDLPIILGDSRQEFDVARWGLVPSWSDGPSGSDPINARAETLTEKPSFRETYRERRCLVPMDGFYEWVEEGGEKQPYYVSRTDGEPFALAGLWAEWTPKQKQTGLEDFAGGYDDPDRAVEPLRSFTIVTTEPNEFFDQYHHRMAVILSPGEEDRWLTDDDPRDLLEPPSVDLEAWPVSTAVNSPANNRPDLIEPVS